MIISCLTGVNEETAVEVRVKIACTMLERERANNRELTNLIDMMVNKGQVSK